MPIDLDRPVSRRAALAGLAAAPLVLATDAEAAVPDYFDAIMSRILELIGRRDYLNDQLNVVWFYILLLYREDRREQADMSRQTYERFRQDFRSEDTFRPVSTGEALIPATVSVGIALSSAVEANIDRLMSAADRALYSAKAAGRNCTVVFGEEETAAPAPGEPNSHAGELVPTIDDQVEALRRMGVLSRAG